LFGIAKFSELVGDAADSPIVLSKDQFFTGAGVAYHF
jgi:outer membrane scaffolding protein for murein synthesis (MipA/OmpV family)